MNDPRLPVAANDDESTNLSANSSFDSVLQARLSRRQLLCGSAGAAALAMLGGASVSSPAWAGLARKGASVNAKGVSKLAFKPVAKSLADAVVVPEGYRYTVLHRLGDPLSPQASEYRNDGTDDPASFEFRAGDHHDGMHYFGLGANGDHRRTEADRGLLCVSHEAITPAFLHPQGPTIVNGARTVPDEVLREFYVHGVSVAEVLRAGGEWRYDINSRFNRRIHTLTPMELSGPAGRTSWMVTKYSRDGSMTRGTVNNCASGATPRRTSTAAGTR